MNGKKLWMYSILFGTITAGLLFLLLGQKTETKNATPVPKTETTSQNEEKKKEEKAVPSTLISVSEGKRAISIPVSEVQGVSGFIKENDFVDVVVLTSSPDGTSVSSQILLQNIKVLAVGSVLEKKSNNEKNTEERFIYRTVTLEVSPNEGSSLVLASNQGSFYLMLRNTNDPSVTIHTHLSMEHLTKGVIPK